MPGAFHSSDATVAAHNAVAVTPSDSTSIPVTRSLYIGVTGSLVVVMADNAVTGTTTTFSNVPVGIFPLQVVKVYSTGTAASGIVALY